jgi:hypothetical protein
MTKKITIRIIPETQPDDRTVFSVWRYTEKSEINGIVTNSHLKNKRIASFEKEDKAIKYAQKLVRKRNKRSDPIGEINKEYIRQAAKVLDKLILNLPKPPIARIIAKNRFPDGGYNTCPECHSSRKSGWSWSKNYNFCINPECEHFTKPIKN